LAQFSVIVATAVEAVCLKRDVPGDEGGIHFVIYQ
jgi:hypothetical protein